jgi:hypothetical protein
MARHEWPAARAELELARDVLAAAGHGDRAFAEHNLGLVAQLVGDHAGALDHFTRAAAVYAATIGGDALAPMRLVLDRARSELALHDPAARDHALEARTAARAAGIEWIEQGANGLLAELEGAAWLDVPGKPVGIDSHIDPAVGPDRPAPSPGSAAEESPRPKPPTPPRPRPDVGVYGPSQPW